MARHFLTLTWSLVLALSGVPRALTAEPLAQKLYPPGGGHFAISLSTCDGGAAVLNGTLTNNTDTTWLYIEIQVKVTRGTSTTAYRLNLERIGPNGGTIRQRIEGAANQECAAIRLSGLELISAQSETRSREKKR